MAKKITNMVEHSTKGELIEFEGGILKTQIVGKNDTKEDEVDVNELLVDIQEFCKANMDKNIELKFSIKVINE